MNALGIRVMEYLYVLRGVYINTPTSTTHPTGFREFVTLNAALCRFDFYQRSRFPRHNLLKNQQP